MATVVVFVPEDHEPAVWAEASSTACLALLLFKRPSPPILPKTKIPAPAPINFKKSRRVNATLITVTLDIKEVSSSLQYHVQIIQSLTDVYFYD
jgi:hypothetical protein